MVDNEPIIGRSPAPANALLLTGGSGLLGRELRRLRPDALAPSSREFDVTDPAGMAAYADAHCTGRTTLLHAAAVTSPPRVEAEPQAALAINIAGSANVAALCLERGWRLVYVSTDYVFRGDRGGYREDDELFPINRYAWSKLGGECAARMCPRSLIIRLSFGPVPFPYPKALVDQRTSREDVATTAAKVARLAESDALGVIHIGAPARTVLEYARAVSGDAAFEPLARADLPFPVPADTSLDCARYDALFPSAPEASLP